MSQALPSCSETQWLEQCPAGAGGKCISTVRRKPCCGNNSAVHDKVEPRVLGDKLEAKNYRTDGLGRISMSHLGTTVELGATSCQAQRYFLECSTILEPSDLHLVTCHLLLSNTLLPASGFWTGFPSIIIKFCFEFTTSSQSLMLKIKEKWFVIHANCLHMKSWALETGAMADSHQRRILVAALWF